MRDERESTVVEQQQIHAHHDRVLAALAARQYGVVARRQLERGGLTPAMLRSRIGNGRPVPLHRGVYAAGHDALRREGRWLAAVLAAGPGAVLSHREAAALHELAPANRPTRLVDLAGVVGRGRLARAVNEAERSHRLDVVAIEDALARTRQRHGSGHAAMRAALAQYDAVGVQVTRSVLEDRFLALLAARQLPRPLTNATVDGIEVDALWPRHRLVVELDGYANHHTRWAFQEDRQRSNELMLAGYLVLRFTHGDVTRRPEYVVTRVARAIAARVEGYAEAPTG